MELQSMSCFLTFKYINKNLLIPIFLQLDFRIYKTLDIYTEGSKKMLNTVFLELASAYFKNLLRNAEVIHLFPPQ